MAELCRTDSLHVPEFTFPWETEGCKSCDKPLHVRVTRKRSKIISTTHGMFEAVELQGYCPQHKHLLPECSQELQSIVAPGDNYAYDTLVQVGLKRFTHYRQAPEISVEFKNQFGIVIPESTVNYLAHKFVAYFQIVHEESIGLLRDAMQERGGYILHIDGTCDKGSRVLLACVDSLSGQVLECHKIGSENHQEVLEILNAIQKKWGMPMAVVHDLRKAFFSAAGEAFPKSPQFACHFHFVADVGKDILLVHQNNLRSLFRREKIKPKIGELIRSLKAFAVSNENQEHVANCIVNQRSKKKLQALCSPETIKGSIHTLAAWILAYKRDGQGYRFPFDMPYLNLYERILIAHEALIEMDQTWPSQITPTQDPFIALYKLRTILDKVVIGEASSEFQQLVVATKRDMKIFTQLRAAMRIYPQGRKRRIHKEDMLKTLSEKQHQAKLNKLRTSLLKHIRKNDKKQRACNIVVTHLDKYWDYLYGHSLKKGTRTTIVPRTNNFLEGIFGIVSRQCRRLHGRGNIGRDLETMPASTPLILNLNNTSYCKTVYRGNEPEKIAERFSKVDTKRVATLIKTWQGDSLSSKLPRKLEQLKSLPKQVTRFLLVAVHTLK